MARSFLTGIGAGLVTSVAGAVGLSLVLGEPNATPPQDMMQETEVPVVPVAEPDADATVPAVESDMPEVAVVDPSLNAPQPDAAPIATPDVAEPDVQQDVDQGVAAETENADVAPAPSEAPTVPQTPTAPDAATADVAPEPVAEPENTPATDGTSPEMADAPEAGTAGIVAPETEAAPAPNETAELPAPDATADAPILDSEPPAPPAEEPEIATIAPLDPSGPVIGKPAGSLLDRTDSARSSRLPTVGQTADAAVSAPASVPVEMFAAEVEIDETLPRMAILLIDDGQGPLGPNALDSFPFPVTFAIDPAAPDAKERMAAYREKGFEVMALVSAPEGATPQDVEVTLEANLVTLPEVVGVMEAPSGGLQTSRAVSDQVAEYLRASGHGLVLQPNGLNTAQALAERLGVPSNSVFRDFDGDGQDPRVQRRFLDQAAFKARQEGGVIMMGRMQADTISALLLWGLQDRAGQVALVPVTKVLSERGL